MILQTRGGRDVEVRSASFFSTVSDIPLPGAINTVSGVRVDVQTAAGLPAVGAAIRLVSEAIGMIPLLVYEGEPEQRKKARDSWQWDLLHNAPNDDYSAFDFFQDISTSIEATGNAYIWKMKVRRGRVEALWVVPPSRVAVKRDDNNRKVFEVYVGDEKQTVNESTILHIRGWGWPGTDVGISPITLYRERLGSMLAEQEFGATAWENNAVPSGVVSYPGPVPKRELDENRVYWEKRHSGVENARRPAFLTRGAEYKAIGLTMQDAQFVESMQFSVVDIARMMRVTPTMLGAVLGNNIAAPTEDFQRFKEVDLMPRLKRIEMAFRNDPDLFPDADLFPQFLPEEVLRVDIKTRYEAYRLGRQGGWLAPNEIRPKENLPPKEGGDDIQVVPVGGMANPDAPEEPDADAG